MKKLPDNETDFNILMEDIDKLLRDKDIPIYARPLHAAREVAIKFKIDVPIVENVYAIKGNYSGFSLSAHIKRWFDKRYGDRLKIDMSLGSAIILIRNDPYRLVLHRIYGRVKLVCDKSLRKYKNIQVRKPGMERKPLYLNILNCVKDITPGLAESLNNSELREIMNFFKGEAKADLKTAVNHILSTHPHFGQSKWSSLQFIEKVMKGFLKLYQNNIPRTHSLKQISKELEKHNIPRIPISLLNNIQCSADVRYDEKLVSMDEAIKAHHSSLDILSILLNDSYNHIVE